MKILVTGANGFVGFYLKGLLAGKGHEVSGLDSAGNADIVCDLADGVGLGLCLRELHPDAVIHLAGIARVDFEQPGEIYRVNTLGTINLLQAAVNVTPVPRFLMVSSSQVYGNPDEKDQPVHENCRVLPVNHYGASKAAAESAAMAFRNEYSMPLVIARPFNHTGRGQSVNFVIPKIVRAFRERHDSLELGNINTVRDFLDVRDVAGAYCAMTESFNDGQIYNIASGEGVMISDVITMCRQITGHNVEIIRREGLVRRSEIRSILGSAAKLQNDLSWKAAHTFRETLEWMLAD